MKLATMGSRLMQSHGQLRRRPGAKLFIRACASITQVYDRCTSSRESKVVWEALAAFGDADDSGYVEW